MPLRVSCWGQACVSSLLVLSATWSRAVDTRLSHRLARALVEQT